MPGTGLRLVPIGAIEALVLAVLTYWVWDQVPGGSRLHYGDDYRLTTWSVASFVIVYVSMPYIQIFQRTSRFSFPYADLYRYSWGNFYIGIIGSGVAGLYWILVEVSAGLFRALGITAIQEIVHEDWFPLVTIPVLMGLGIAICKENDRTIDRLREIFATTFRVLFPMLAAIVLSFLCVLPVTGLTPLWDTKWALAILLAVLLLVVLFINAVYQDGDTAVTDRPWYRRGMTAVIVAMPVFTVLSLYSLTLRIDQYGFTPDRLYALIFAGVLGIYGLGYGLAVLRRGGKWLAFLQPVNIALSLVVAGLALLLHTPVLDPLRLSADSQYRRLASSEAGAATFDYGTLRFDLGHAGHEKLQALRQLSESSRAGDHRRAGRGHRLDRGHLELKTAAKGGVGAQDDGRDVRGAQRLAAYAGGAARQTRSAARTGAEALHQAP